MKTIHIDEEAGGFCRLTDQYQELTPFSDPFLVFDLVIRGLKASPTRELDEDHILGQLALTFPRERPQRILHTLVFWASYTDLFRYSAPRRVLHGLSDGPATGTKTAAEEFPGRHPGIARKSAISQDPPR